MCKFYIILSLNKPNPKAESIERDSYHRINEESFPSSVASRMRAAGDRTCNIGMGSVIPLV